MSDAARVIVHFGMPKTGTTSIQLSLARRLSDPNFRYITFEEGDTNYAIATGFKAKPAADRRHVKLGTPSEQLPRLREAIVRRLTAELQAAGGRTAILSAEMISNLKEPEFRDLHGVLSAGGARVTAVGYVRRPKETMESAFQQQVKSGRQAFGMERLFPNYRARLQKIDEVLGRGNTRVWLFDPSRFPGQCVVQDICFRLGIAFQPEDVIRFNDGLSRPALSLLYAYRKFGPGYGVGPHVIRENRMLIQRLRALSGPKLRLHSGLVAPVIERRSKLVRWMEHRLGTSLAEDLAAHDADAIRSEEDLLTFDRESIRWLATELQEDPERLAATASPVEIAGAVHRLRARLAAGQPRR